MAMQTLGGKLAAANNRPSGFDYIRISLAVSLVAWHTIQVCYGFSAEAPIWTGVLCPLPAFIVPSFFALSGFLVAGSLERNDLPSFLTLRALRIFPALVVEVVISALVIGAAVTALPLSAYVSDVHLYRYFLNIVGDIHFYLPGVFKHNQTTVVNGQLWTIPFELECYLAISVISLLGLYRRTRGFFALLIAASLAAAAWSVFKEPRVIPQAVVAGRTVVACFLFGVLLFRHKDAIPFNRGLFVASILLAILFLEFRQTTILAALPVAYATAYVGVLSFPRTFVIAGADYSYGVYLYGYPIQQLVYYSFPWARVWWINLPISLVAITLFAAFSWHVVESKVMARRKPALRWVQSTVARIPMAAQLLGQRAWPNRGRGSRRLRNVERVRRG